MKFLSGIVNEVNAEFGKTNADYDCDAAARIPRTGGPLMMSMRRGPATACGRVHGNPSMATRGEGIMSLYWFYVRTLGPLAAKWFTPDVIGVENVPAHGPAIIASNHLAVIDDAVIPLETPRMVHFMGKQEYFTGKGLKGRFKKFFFTSAGVFPVDRSGGDEALGGLASARRILEKGELFGIHPEGTRSPDGRLYRGHSGVARLAFETGAPIVPVALTGTDLAQPIGTVWPRKHHTTIQYGEPIQVPKTPADGVTHDMIRLLMDEVMHRIAAMSGQEYVDEYAQSYKKRIKAFEDGAPWQNTPVAGADENERKAAAGVAASDAEADAQKPEMRAENMDFPYDCPVAAQPVVSKP